MLPLPKPFLSRVLVSGSTYALSVMLEHASYTTCFLLANLHCPSCINTITATLSSLQLDPNDVSPSILTSIVTVRHSRVLRPKDICVALGEVGFEVTDITQAPDSNGAKLELDLCPSHNHLNKDVEEGQSSAAQTLQDIAARSRIQERHMLNCNQCRDQETLSGHIQSTSQTPSAMVKSAELLEAKLTRSGSFTGVTIGLNTDDVETRWRAAVAIGGMTCGACANTIQDELRRQLWIKEVYVNLIENSASIEFVDYSRKDDITEMIEDMGFEAILDTVVKLQESSHTALREIDLRIDGMFCNDCPTRIEQSLITFNEQVQVVSPATIVQPIIRLSYIPQQPNVNIRRIMDCLAAVDPCFTISLYHDMTLEERSRKLHDTERHRILIRVCLTVVIAIPTFIIGIVLDSLVTPSNRAGRYLSKPWTAGVSRAQWSLFILASPVYFFAADVFHRRALKEICNLWKPSSKTPIARRFYRFGSMNLLMSLGTSIAYVSSVAQLITAACQRSRSFDDGTFYFDSVVFLTMFLLIGRLIEAYSKSRTGDAVTMLAKMRPAVALLVTEATQAIPPSIEEISVDLLENGDTVAVLHGASPPCDGNVISGDGTFDESSLTGESRPAKKCVGDMVFSGTINRGGPVKVLVAQRFGNSMLDQIIQTVREGQTKRAPIEQLADRLTAHFVPAITFVAILTWICWLALGLSGKLPTNYKSSSNESWTTWSLSFAIAVFVVACPCGLALAAPTALFVGGGLAAQRGILVKGGGEAFEKASHLDCIVFDKTGTLTLGGEPDVTDYEFLLQSAPDHVPVDESQLLCMLRGLEEHSSHTVATAIVSHCSKSGAVSSEFHEVRETPGKGLSGATLNCHEIIDRMELLVGNESLMEDEDVTISDTVSVMLECWKKDGKSVALVAIRRPSSKWSLAAVLGISDPVRPEAHDMITTLRGLGFSVWMMSGDNQTTANAVGLQVGIDSSNIVAGVLPAEKAEHIKRLQMSLKSGARQAGSAQRALVAMVGDGVNDAPALSVADIGIAIGSGSDIAISMADFVLISTSLNSLVTLIELSKVVFRRIRFNFGWALLYNLIGVPVAAGVLYPIVSNGSHIKLDPIWASLAMALSSISVVCSSLALRSAIPGIGFRSTTREQVE